MRRFVSTHRSVCDRIGVKLAPETDKEKAYSCETGGTLLGVVYNTVMWSWNFNTEKLKGILHKFYHMHGSVWVSDKWTSNAGHGKIAHYGPLFPDSKWWRKPLTSLYNHNAGKRKMLKLATCAKIALRWWIMMFNQLHLGNLPIMDPLHLFPASHIPIDTDASCVHMQKTPWWGGGRVVLDEPKFGKNGMA